MVDRVTRFFFPPKSVFASEGIELSSHQVKSLGTKKNG